MMPLPRPVYKRGEIVKVRIVFFGGLCLAMFLLWYYYEPWLYINEIAWAVDDHAETTTASKHLISLGPRAVGPILRQIGSCSPYSKSAAALPGVLAQMGEPAHQQLLSTIDATKDYQTRSYYLYTLHVAFRDYSRLPGWLNEAERHPADFIVIYRSLFLTYGSEVPYVQGDHTGFSLEFLEWYKQHSKPLGVLPKWEPQ